MSLPALLGTTFVLLLVCPDWAAAAEHKSKQSTIASDRHASPARLSRKEAAHEQRSRKGVGQREEEESSKKQSAQKRRTQKEAAAKEPAQNRPAEKGAQKPRAQKAASQKEEARKNSTPKEQAQKAAAHKQDKRKEAAKKERVQKEGARKEASQEDEETRKDTTRKGRAQKQASGKKRNQQESAQADRAQKERAQDDQREARRAALQASSDNETLAALRQKLRALRKQVGDMENLRAELAAMENLRAELAAIKAQIQGSAPKPTIWGGVPLTLPPSLSTPPRRHTDVAWSGSPHAREVDRAPLLPPVDPAAESLRAVIRQELGAAPPAEFAVEEAKIYLVKTARPGYTMLRQGVWLAIDRLHPGFAVKLAEAVRRARAEGMTETGVFSAYRPPAFGVGGFRNKFDSLHSYGLATDIVGIGRPGSASARRWHEIVLEVGLYLPYGPDHRVEFNHTQFIPAKVAPTELRETITADGPKDLREMWLASGLDAYVTEPPATAVATGPGNEVSSGTGAREPSPIVSMRDE